MIKKREQELTRRLATAIREARDADRVWRRAMAASIRDESQRDPVVQRGLDALWQERERAHSRVHELRWAVAQGQRQAGLVHRLRNARRVAA